MATKTDVVEGFAARVKRETDGEHSDAEGSSFMSDLLKGTLPESAYVSLLVQQWFVYRALEDAGRALEDDPVAAPFLDDKLLRMAQLEADLRFHLGDDFADKISPLPSTERYADRITEISGQWSPGFVAHHYLRYMGDLSGGQIIRRLMERAYGYDTDGVRFYIFDQIPKTKPYKDDYRAHMDALDLDEPGKQRFIAEVAAAFRFNRDMFADLAAEVDRARGDA